MSWRPNEDVTAEWMLRLTNTLHPEFPEFEHFVIDQVGRVVGARGIPRARVENNGTTSHPQSPGLIDCPQFCGVAIYDPRRELMGSIAKIFVKSDDARVSYILAKFDVLGLGNEYFPLPWLALKYNPAIFGYQTHLIKRQLLAAPRYPASSDFDLKREEIEAAIHKYYGRCY